MTTRRLFAQYLCSVVSPVSGPKYLSVREHLRRRVASLPELTLLPPEPVLCAEYGVSRITLRRAVDGLVADGHLVREQGRGTYVTRPAIRHEYRESFVHRIAGFNRSEEHTSELQSRQYLVCRLLLEKKNKINSVKIIRY